MWYRTRVTYDEMHHTCVVNEKEQQVGFCSKKLCHQDMPHSTYTQQLRRHYLLTYLLTYEDIISDGVSDKHHPAPLWRYCDFGAIHKWSNLITYLPIKWREKWPPLIADRWSVCVVVLTDVWCHTSPCLSQRLTSADSSAHRLSSLL